MTPSVVVVTGASAGVGRAVVRAFAARGASIGLIARGHAGLEGARREIERAGGRAYVCAVDVADAGAVERAAAQIEEALGPIDVWVNAAMTSVFAFTWDVAPAELRRVTDVTYHGTVWGTMAAVRRMRERDRGTIVQVGRRGLPLAAAPGGVLRGEVRRARVHGRASQRAVARAQPRRGDDGPAAGAQHAPVRLGAQPDAGPAATTGAGLRAGVAAEATVHSSTIRARAVRRGPDHVGRRAELGCAGRPRLVPRAGRSRAAAASRAGPAGAARQPLGRAGRPVDWGARGRFGDEAKPQGLHLRASMHRGALAAASIGAAGALAIARLRSRR